MFMKIIAAAVALGFIVTVPGASFAAGDNDKSVSSTKAAVNHKKPKKGWSDTVHENASYPYGVAPVYPYNPAPAYASPGLEYGYMDTQSYGSIGASGLGYAYGLDNQSNGQAYCMRRFRSYDPGTGTYLGYDGVRHPCP